MSPAAPSQSSSAPKPGPHLYLRAGVPAQPTSGQSAAANGGAKVPVEPFKLVDLPQLDQGGEPAPSVSTELEQGTTAPLASETAVSASEAAEHSEVEEPVTRKSFSRVAKLSESAVEATTEVAQEAVKRLHLSASMSEEDRGLRERVAEELRECPEITGIYPGRMALWHSHSDTADPELVQLDEAGTRCQVRVGVSSEYGISRALKQVAQRVIAVMRQNGVKDPQVKLTAVTVE